MRFGEFYYEIDVRFLFRVSRASLFKAVDM